MNIIKVKDTLTVVFDDGITLVKEDCTLEEFQDVVSHAKDEEYVKQLLSPKLVESLEEVRTLEEFVTKVTGSEYMTLFGASIYIKSISELSVPQDLAKELLQAEKQKDKERIQSLLNFWTLVSLNPDSRARMNLFWFLKKYGMPITKSGLFVAYRNVVIKKTGKVIDENLTQIVSEAFVKIKHNKKSPNNFFVLATNLSGQKYYSISKYSDNLEEGTACLGTVKELYENMGKASEDVTVYTDAHTGSTTITLGNIVRIPREKCDSVQENTCSRGLHVASASWLRDNGSSFGKTTMLVLVNPADVVAVPPSDSYGKMRTCAYYPVQIISKSDLETENVKLYQNFEDDFIQKIIVGESNNNDENPYFIGMPTIPEISSSNIKRNLERLKDFRKNVL